MSKTMTQERRIEKIREGTSYVDRAYWGKWIGSTWEYDEKNMRQVASETVPNTGRMAYSFNNPVFETEEQAREWEQA